MLVDDVTEASVQELIARATRREPMKNADSLSGSHLERLQIDGLPYVLKHLHVDDDWVQRTTGDVTCRAVHVWRSGILDRVRHFLDDAIVGCVGGLGRNGWGAMLLLRDVSECFVPTGNGPIPAEQHDRFIDHMAAFHAAFWGFEDTIGLLPMGNRYLLTTPLTAEVEADLGGTDAVPRLLPDGWARLPRVAPRSAALTAELARDPSPLVEALDATPQTFVHSDWKLGNLGSHPDGRTILVDWAFPGRAPGCADLAWYVAVNCDRLPRSKEDTIAGYRSALERHGVDTGGWFDRQLGLSLIGAFVQLGWSKTFDGNPRWREELDWWEARVPEAARWL